MKGRHFVVRPTWIVWINLVLVCCSRLVRAEIGYFWHISDLHLDAAYSMKGDVSKSCWHHEHRQPTAPSRQPGPFGDYMCDSPWALLESATQAMKTRQGDNVEFVLWTGDGLSHSTRRLIESHRLELLRNITDLLGRTFSSQFVFPVLGHEDSQGNSFRRLGELWRHWLPSEALQTFEKGGYYTIEQTKSRLRIIVLNTNFMRHDIKYPQTHSAAVRQRPGVGSGGGGGGGGGGNSGSDSSDYGYHGYGHHGGGHYRQVSPGSERTVYGRISGVEHGSNGGGGGTVSALSGGGGAEHEAQKQWDWLEEVLAKSSRNKETVYMVGHIPPGSDERQTGSLPNGHTTFSEKNNLRYLKLVRKYSNIIRGQFFGHLHSDSFRIIYSESGNPVSWIMMAPSVTPRKSNVGSNNPALRLYKFDTDTGQVLDYTQYYLDLDAANAQGEALWQAEYNLTTQYFGSGEVNAVALHNLADRFPSGESPLFAKYYRANTVRYQTGPCEGVCALNHYCAITRVDYREFRQCLETAASALASSSKSSGASISHAMLLAAVLLVTLVHRVRAFERCVVRPLAAVLISLDGLVLRRKQRRQQQQEQPSDHRCMFPAFKSAALVAVPCDAAAAKCGCDVTVAAAAAICSRPHNSGRPEASSICTRPSPLLATAAAATDVTNASAATPPTTTTTSTPTSTASTITTTTAMSTTISTIATTTAAASNINICQSRRASAIAEAMSAAAAAAAAAAAVVGVAAAAAADGRSSFSVKMHESANACRTPPTPTITPMST